MRDINELYQLWIKQNLEDEELVADLKVASDSQEERKDRFYKDLEFGTAGLRGIIGAGTNRMNIYTVGLATQGFANFLLRDKEQKKVAISYDSRKNSELFAKRTASIFAANGIKVYIYDTLMPTPMLSFAVRELGCDGGVMVTASHNPAKYNGFKAYGNDGCQIGPDIADEILKEISYLNAFSDVLSMDFDQGLEKNMIEYISEEVIDKFYQLTLDSRVFPEATEKASVKIIFTPLNGAGNLPVRKVLKMAGHNDIEVVKEQELPDVNFTTCPYPNPEFKEALELGLRDAKAKDAELLIATDPDCDRVGIAVKDDGEFTLLTGNEVGVMMLEYIAKGLLEKGKFPPEPVAVKTIVSTPLTDKICEKYGIDLKDVLTGFKFIGNEITKLEEMGKENNYLLGFEESYGYLKGIHVRDKDAVLAPLLIAEMACYYKMKGKTLKDVRKEMYDEYGYLLNFTENFAFPGADGMTKMSEIMTRMRDDKFQNFPRKLVKFADYLEQYQVDYVSMVKLPIDLPKSNVLSFTFEGEVKILMRPSGTEPKLKLYYTTSGASFEESTRAYEKVSAEVKDYLDMK